MFFRFCCFCIVFFLQLSSEKKLVSAHPTPHVSAYPSNPSPDGPRPFPQPNLPSSVHPSEDSSPNNSPTKRLRFSNLPSEEDCANSTATSPNPFPGDCGRRVIATPSARRVVGGSALRRGAAPWHADLNGCGATIVDARHVVTAAHCIADNIGLEGSLVHAGHVLRLFSKECTRQSRYVSPVQVVNSLIRTISVYV
jgi:hypothetical protein